MKKFLAALAGAIVAPIVVLLGVAVLYSAPSPESWDLGTPLLTLGALLPAAFLGAAVGYVIAEFWLTGSRRTAGWFGGAGALLVILIPVGIVLYPYLLSILPSRPLTAEEKRAAWAQHMGQTPGPVGAQLAERLRGCLGEEGVPASGEAVIGRGCEELRAHWLGLGADRIAKLGAYTDADDGWRWDLVDSAGQRRLRVFPDPLLHQANPTFEMGRGQVARHDAPAVRDAGSDAMLPRLARFRRCLRDLAIEVRGSGTWAGLGDTLPLLLRASTAEARCPGARIEQSPDRPRFAGGCRCRTAKPYRFGSPISRGSRTRSRPRSTCTCSPPTRATWWMPGAGGTCEREGGPPETIRRPSGAGRIPRRSAGRATRDAWPILPMRSRTPPPIVQGQSDTSATTGRSGCGCGGSTSAAPAGTSSPASSPSTRCGATSARPGP
jgi:hypothetical protein